MRRSLISILFERFFARKLWGAWRGCIEAGVIPGSGGIVFLGDSITHQARWDLMFPHSAARNFGIGGERSEHLLLRLDPMVSLRPEKIFILIGSNDVAAARSIDDICQDVETLVERLQAQLPGCPIHLQGVMPRARKMVARIRELNARYAQIAARRGLGFIDLFPAFDDGAGMLKKEFTYDAIHLTGSGYAVWRAILEPHVTGRSGS